jgi:hypothetical protein
MQKKEKKKLRIPPTKQRWGDICKGRDYMGSMDVGYQYKNNITNFLYAQMDCNGDNKLQ